MARDGPLPEIPWDEYRRVGIGTLLWVLQDSFSHDILLLTHRTDAPEVREKSRLGHLRPKEMA